MSKATHTARASYLHPVEALVTLLNDINSDRLSADERPDDSAAQRARPVIGLALGAGVARGWSHIGVLRELAANGISPSIIAGSSVGAVVGGCAAAGELDGLESFARGMTKRGIFNLIDFSLSGGGLMAGRKLRALLDKALRGLQIEDMPTRFAAVATEVGSGHEIWLTRGPLAKALQASYAMPGIFEPIRFGERWLFDGALVNPIPVTACRVLGADLVIAVSITQSPRLRSAIVAEKPEPEDMGTAPEALTSPASSGFFGGLRAPKLPFRRHFTSRGDDAPGMAQLMTDAFNITQDRIARSRLAGDPPDALVRVRTSDIGLFEFHRADELIDLGRQAAVRALPEIRELIEQVAPATS